MPWTWDLPKNRANETKHRVPFETALKVFADEHAITYRDPYPDELRFREPLNKRQPAPPNPSFRRKPESRKSPPDTNLAVAKSLWIPAQAGMTVIQRFLRTIGYAGPLLLLVIHTEEELDLLTGERTGRIISARKATRAERAIYAEK